VAMISLGFGVLTSAFALVSIAFYFMIKQMWYDNEYNFSQSDALSYALLNVVIWLVFSTLLITAGLGILQRKRWSRRVAILVSLLTTFLGLSVGVNNLRLFIQHDMNSLKEFIIPLVLISYSIFLLTVLFRKKYKAEFS
jgi:glucan phosphoethanolaminetransferase (alkaline phosphatase superfamily)